MNIYVDGIRDQELQQHIMDITVGSVEFTSDSMDGQVLPDSRVRSRVDRLIQASNLVIMYWDEEREKDLTEVMRRVGYAKGRRKPVVVITDSSESPDCLLQAVDVVLPMVPDKPVPLEPPLRLALANRSRAVRRGLIVLCLVSVSAFHVLWSWYQFLAL